MRDRKGILEIHVLDSPFAGLCYERMVLHDGVTSHVYRRDISRASYQRLCDFAHAHLDRFKFRPLWSYQILGWVAEEVNHGQS